MTKQEALEFLSRNKARLKEFRVSSMFLFGSVVRGEAAPKSDIDILVEFDKDACVGLFELVRLKSFLSEILGTEADFGNTRCIAPHA